MKSESSYKEIAKSTGVFGSSQLVNVFLGIIRSKLTAIFLGTVGVGIFGIFQSIIDFNRSISGLGLDSGAVKELATSKANDGESLGRTVYTIKIWYLFTAFLGALVCLIFAKRLSIWAFDDDSYTSHIMGLSISIFFIALSTGLTAILQGLRKIPFLALASTLSSIISLIVMIPIYYRWGIQAIIPMFILLGIINFSISYFFYKKLKIETVKISIKNILKNGSKMLELGIFIVIGGVISTGSLLAVRAYISRVDGLDNVGLFHVAWVTTTLFWGIILRSSNTDFFPKLCSIVETRTMAKRFVNEQTHFVLLVISPLIIGLIVFSKYVIQILFTTDFILASNTLQWHLMGAFFKIAATPIASIMLAKSRGGIHLICEIIFWGTYLLTGYLLYPSLNIEALGIAYLVSYLIYIPAVIVAGYLLSRTVWDSLSVKIVIMNIVLFILIYLTIHQFHEYYILIGILLILVSGVFSWYYLRQFFSFKKFVLWIKNRFIH